VHVHKYRGAPKDEYRGKEETIVVDLKEGVVLAAHKYRASPNDFHPHFNSRKESEVSCKEQTSDSIGGIYGVHPVSKP
jgi:hypothetical protein